MIPVPERTALKLPVLLLATPDPPQHTNYAPLAHGMLQSPLLALAMEPILRLLPRLPIRPLVLAFSRLTVPVLTRIFNRLEVNTQILVVVDGLASIRPEVLFLEIMLPPYATPHLGRVPVKPLLIPFS